MNIKAKRLVSFCLCLTAVATGAAFYYASDRDDALGAGPYSELMHHVAMINIDLEKLSCAPEGKMADALAAELYKNSALAGEAIARLAAEGAPMWKADLYVDRVGEYSLNLLRNGADEWSADNLGRLGMASGELLSALAELKTGLDNGICDYSAISAELSALEAGLSDHGDINYAGKLSAHLEGLRGTPSEAAHPEKYRAAAARYLECSESEVGKCECIPGVVSFTGDDGSRAELSPSGRLLALSHPSEPVEAVTASAGEYDAAPALREAAEHLKNMGFGAVRPGFWQVGTEITATFFPVRSGVIFMSDPICCRLGRDGSILSLSASEFGAWNVTGIAPSADATGMDIAASGGFTVLGTELVMLDPNESGRILCRRMHCMAPSGREVYLFIDAGTGEAVDMLLLRSDDSGFYGE